MEKKAFGTAVARRLQRFLLVVAALIALFGIGQADRDLASIICYGLILAAALSIIWARKSRRLFTVENFRLTSMELSRAAGVQRLTYLASLLLCLGSIALLVAMLIFGQRLVHWLNYDWIAISLFLSIGTVLESLVRNRNGAVPLIVYWGFLTCQFLQWLGRESLSVLSLIDILFLGSVVVGLLTAIINILVTQRGGSRSTVKS